MKHPEVFSALYAMSSCCLVNDPGGAAKTSAKKPAQINAKTPAAKEGAPGRNISANRRFAKAAAWAPNPANPPRYFDMPIKDGQIQSLVVAKYAANSPLAMVGQYVPNLKKYRAIAMDVGDKDNLKTMNIQLHEELTRFGIDHTFEEYDGGHGNRVKERVQNNVMNFFSEQLMFP